MSNTANQVNRITSDLSQCQDETPAWFSKVSFEIYSLIAGNLDCQDIYNFFLTCKTMSIVMFPHLLRRDVDTKRYNALAWACYFGNSSLARQCLSIGASPNATFWTTENKAHPPHFVPKNPMYMTYRSHRGFAVRQTMVLRAHDHADLEFPVRPTKFLYGHHFLKTIFPFSALCLATMRNHVPVMQVLLEFGARQFDHRVKVITTLTPWSYVPVDYYYRSLDHPHQVALSHVRSFAAAKLLLNTGGGEFINTCGDSPFTPLEMVLSHFQQWRVDRSSCPFARRIAYTDDIPELEMKHLIKLLLRNGASPRRPLDRVLSDGHKHTACNGPLEAAIATGIPWLIELILQQGSTDPSLPENSEFAELMSLALSDFRPSNPADTEERNPFGHELLARLEEAGFPITERIAGLLPLPTAIYEAVAKGHYSTGQVDTLLSAGACPDETDPGRLCPLSQAVVASTFEKRDSKPPEDYVTNAAVKQICRLLEKRAEIDNPAFGPMGFTPLFIATAELVPSKVFEILLERGASWKGITCQLAPGKPFYTLLQCLFMGLPAFASGDNIQWPEGLVRPGKDIGFGDIVKYSYAQKRRKFRKLTKMGTDLLPEDFYAEDNQHILHWVIRNLSGLRLLHAAYILCPVYYQRKRSDDHENALWILFSDTERRSYLSVGILQYRAEVVKSLVQEIPRQQLEYVDEKGETILHLVSQLQMDIPNQQELELVRESCGRDLDFGVSFLRGLENREDLFQNRSEPLYTSEQLHAYIQAHKTEYLENRRRSICLILDVLLQNAQGINLYTHDNNGKTPYEYIRGNGILDLISPKFRDETREGNDAGQ